MFDSLETFFGEQLMEGLSHFGIVNGLTIFGELETLNKKHKISLKNVWQLFLFWGFYKQPVQACEWGKKKHICSNMSYTRKQRCTYHVWVFYSTVLVSISTSIVLFRHWKTLNSCSCVLDPSKCQTAHHPGCFIINNGQTYLKQLICLPF